MSELDYDLTDAPSGQFGRKYYITLGMLVCLGLAVRVAHWYPGYGSDDTTYMAAAAKLAHGEPPVPLQRHWNTRVAYLAFLAAGMSVLGFSTAVCQGLGLSVFAATACTIAALTGKLGGARSSLLATGLYVLLPLDVVLSTCALPDPLMTLLVLVGCLLVVNAGDCRGEYARFALAMSAGAMFGLAVSAKEMACVAGLPVVIYLAWQLRPWQFFAATTGIVVGGLFILALECLGFAAWLGDPYFRFNLTSAVFATEGEWSNPTSSLRQAAYYIIHIGDTVEEYGVHGFLLVLGALLALNHRSGRSIFPLLFIVLAGVYLSVGTAHLTTYVLVPHHTRYFHIVLAMGCVLAGLELPTALHRLRLHVGVSCLLCLLLVGVSLWAAKEVAWRGTVPVAKWLASLAPDERLEYVALDRVVSRQALEVRKEVNDCARLSDAAASPQAIANELQGRGLVIDRRELSVAAYGEERLERLEERLLNDCQVKFHREEIFGEPWPPYKKWIGFGAEKQLIGSILRVESDKREPGPPVAE